MCNATEHQVLGKVEGLGRIDGKRVFIMVRYDDAECYKFEQTGFFCGEVYSHWYNF